MARDLKKFVNPRFLKTVDLHLLRRLFERQPADRVEFALTIFDQEDAAARAALQTFFEGPEDQLPQGLVADLHRIAELGTENGMRLLQERAARYDVQIGDPSEDGEQIALDPKHFAILVFLDYRRVFDAASDLLAREARSSVAEYVGNDEGVEPRLDATSKGRLEAAAAEMFRRDHRGAYCRVGWYDDNGQLTIVVTHGAPVSIVPVVDGDREDVISYRSLEYAVLAYNVGTGRLGVGGVPKARRAELAEIFATHMLGRSGFFAGEDCQDLYTLEPIERAGLRFEVDRSYDPLGILRAQIVEVQIDRFGPDPAGGPPIVVASHATKGFRGDALECVAAFAGQLSFRSGVYRIGHIVMRIQLASARVRPVPVTVKIKPPSVALFKRQRFEQRVMELLNRNGFCCVRQPGEAAAAAD